MRTYKEIKSEIDNLSLKLQGLDNNDLIQEYEKKQLKLLDEVIEIFPESILAYLHKSLIFLKNKNKTQAIEMFQKIFAIEPNKEKIILFIISQIPDQNFASLILQEMFKNDKNVNFINLE